jgi:two-component system LytT family response regulator
MKERITAMIVDDEPRSITSLKWELQPFENEVHVVGEATSGKEAIPLIRELSPDVVFLDIEMPGMNGFELIKALQPIDFHVVFTTAYDKFAIRAFEMSALDYLLKPVTEEDLGRVINKLHEMASMDVVHKQMEHLLNNMRLKDPRFGQVVIPTLEGLEFIELTQIVRCESEANYTHIHMEDGSKHFVSKTLKHIELMLGDNGFFRIHNSHLVNIRFIKKYLKGKAGSIQLKDGTSVPVSRNKKHDFLDIF